MIDKEDVVLIQDYKWCYKEGYAMTGQSSKNDRTNMHRLIMNAPDDKIVDHINHNTLDNRKCNLRLCTNTENCRNSKNAKGIYDNGCRKWKAIIGFNGKLINLGSFADKKEALKVRREAEIKYFGEFAPIRKGESI